MSAIKTYFKERFPLLPSALLSAVTALLLVGVFTEPSNGPVRIASAAIVTIGFLSFLLRQRVIDEFKDFEHDRVNFPNRPLHRGAIKPLTLATLGTSAFVAEITCAWLLAVITGSFTSLIWYAAVLGFSILTAFEFFVGRWLNEHFTIYFLSHQIIFIFFSLWIASVNPTLSSETRILGTLAVVLVMSALEIMRKFEIRLDPENNVVKDTYPAVWGRTNSVIILASNFLTAGAVLVLIKGLATTLVGVFAFALIMIFGFTVDSGVESKRNTLIQGLAILASIGFSLVVFFV